MKSHWFINTLLAVLFILPLLAGGFWWWSIQPRLLSLTHQEQQVLTLPQGIQVHLLSDPELRQTQMQWRWAVGTSADPEDQLGRHQLFMRALMGGQLNAAQPSLAVHMAKDPLGQYSVDFDRQHTQLRFKTSAGATADTLRFVAQMLSQTDWSPELMRIYRESLTDIDPPYAFMPRVEAQHIDRIRPMVRPLLQSTSVWLAQEPNDLSQIMERYVEDYFFLSQMTLSMQSPLPLAELEQKILADFAQALQLRSNRVAAPPLSEQHWALRGAMRFGMTASDPQAQNVRLIFPWLLPPHLQLEVAGVVAWLNSPLAQAPRQQLQAAELLEDVWVHVTDEMLVFELKVEDSDDDQMPALLASMQRLLGQLLTAEQRNQLRFDPHHFWLYDRRASAANQTGELPTPDPRLAQVLAPPPVTLPMAQVNPPRSSQHELIGWQPRLVRSDESWQVWHLPDQHFGTRLTHLSVYWPHPIGPDPLLHTQWQQWLERHGPGLTEDVWQAQQQVLSGAQGFRVEVDATGIHWHITHDWPTIAQWLPQWLTQMQQQSYRPSTALEPSLALHQLLRTRAQFSAVPALKTTAFGPMQLLVAGQVEEAALMNVLAQMAVSTPDEHVKLLPPWRLAEGHQLAEVAAPSGLSRASTWLELPSSDPRHRTLAEASLPWIQATLEQRLLARGIAAQLTVALTAPAGRLGLEVILDSQSMDPARLNLQLTALWRDLAEASQNKSANTLEHTLQWRAERYREAPLSLAAASQFYWADIVAQRLHFNGQLRSARILESTNLDGWAFFMHQWLFANTARRLSVNEVGENWAQTYRELRRPPPDARPW